MHRGVRIVRFLEPNRFLETRGMELNSLHVKRRGGYLDQSEQGVDKEHRYTNPAALLVSRPVVPHSCAVALAPSPPHAWSVRVHIEAHLVIPIVLE